MEKESGYDISAERKYNGESSGPHSAMHDKMKPGILKGSIKKGDTSFNREMYKKDGIKDGGKSSY